MAAADEHIDCRRCRPCTRDDTCEVCILWDDTRWNQLSRAVSRSRSRRKSRSPLGPSLSAGGGAKGGLDSRSSHSKSKSSRPRVEKRSSKPSPSEGGLGEGMSAIKGGDSLCEGLSDGSKSRSGKHAGSGSVLQPMDEPSGPVITGAVTTGPVITGTGDPGSASLAGIAGPSGLLPGDAGEGDVGSAGGSLAGSVPTGPVIAGPVAGPVAGLVSAGPVITGPEVDHRGSYTTGTADQSTALGLGGQRLSSMDNAGHSRRNRRLDRDCSSGSSSSFCDDHRRADSVSSGGRSKSRSPSPDRHRSRSSERSGHDDRSGRGDRSGRSDRSGRDYRSGRDDRFGRSVRSGRDDRSGRGDDSRHLSGHYRSHHSAVPSASQPFGGQALPRSGVSQPSSYPFQWPGFMPPPSDSAGMPPMWGYGGFAPSFYPPPGWPAYTGSVPPASGVNVAQSTATVAHSRRRRSSCSPRRSGRDSSRHHSRSRSPAARSVSPESPQRVTRRDTPPHSRARAIPLETVSPQPSPERDAVSLMDSASDDEMFGDHSVSPARSQFDSQSQLDSLRQSERDVNISHMKSVRLSVRDALGSEICPDPPAPAVSRISSALGRVLGTTHAEESDVDRTLRRASSLPCSPVFEEAFRKLDYHARGLPSKKEDPPALFKDGKLQSSSLGSLPMPADRFLSSASPPIQGYKSQYYAMHSDAPLSHQDIPLDRDLRETAKTHKFSASHAFMQTQERLSRESSRVISHIDWTISALVKECNRLVGAEFQSQLLPLAESCHQALCHAIQLQGRQQANYVLAKRDSLLQRRDLSFGPQVAQALRVSSLCPSTIFAGSLGVAKEAQLQQAQLDAAVVAPQASSKHAFRAQPKSSTASAAKQPSSSKGSSKRKSKIRSKSSVGSAKRQSSAQGDYTVTVGTGKTSRNVVQKGRH